MPAQQPKYQQVIDWVTENIASGTLKPGDKLMSEAELSEKFGLSRQTVRRATGDLANMGVVVRIKGSGTYIGGEASPVLLPRDRTMTIAVVSTFNETYIFPETLKGIEKILSKNGYAMQVYFTDNRLYKEKTILTSILEKDQVDGLIVEPVKSALPNPNLQYYNEILNRNIPILFFNTYYPNLDVPCVRIDDAGTAAKAAQLLIDAGHTKIAGIFKGDDGQGPMRYQGYLEAMMGASLQPRQENILWLDTMEIMHLSDIADHLLNRINGCTGVVCYNDQVAYQLIEIALSRNIRIPEDLSIVGIDDSYLAGVSKVPFTSFVHPKEILGRKAAENMLQLLSDPAFDADFLFESEPVLRGSVKQLA